MYDGRQKCMVKAKFMGCFLTKSSFTVVTASSSSIVQTPVIQPLVHSLKLGKMVSQLYLQIRPPCKVCKITCDNHDQLFRIKETYKVRGQTSSRTKKKSRGLCKKHFWTGTHQPDIKNQQNSVCVAWLQIHPDKNNLKNANQDVYSELAHRDITLQIKMSPDGHAVRIFRMFM